MLPGYMDPVIGPDKDGWQRTADSMGEVRQNQEVVTAYLDAIAAQERNASNPLFAPFDPRTYQRAGLLGDLQDFKKENPLALSPEAEQRIAAEKASERETLMARMDYQTPQAELDQVRKMAEAKYDLGAKPTPATLSAEEQQKIRAGIREEIARSLEKTTPVQEATLAAPDRSQEQYRQLVEARKGFAQEIDKAFETNGQLDSETLTALTNRGREDFGLRGSEVRDYAERLNVKARQGVAENLRQLTKQGELTPEAIAQAATEGQRYGLSEQDIQRFIKKEGLNVRSVGRSEAIERGNLTQFSRLDQAQQDQNSVIGTTTATGQGARPLSVPDRLLRAAEKAREAGASPRVTDNLINEAVEYRLGTPQLPNVGDKNRVANQQEQLAREAEETRRRAEEANKRYDEIFKNLQ